jgi:hypothetical protein
MLENLLADVALARIVGIAARTKMDFRKPARTCRRLRGMKNAKPFRR